MQQDTRLGGAVVRLSQCGSFSTQRTIAENLHAIVAEQVCRTARSAKGMCVKICATGETVSKFSPAKIASRVTMVDNSRHRFGCQFWLLQRVNISVVWCEENPQRQEIVILAEKE